MKRTKKKIRILTNDPSTTAWGWAVVTPKGKVIEIGCIKTEPSDKKLKIRKGDDRVRRISEITYKLLEVIKTHNISFVVSEITHGSQSSSGAVAIGVVTAILQTICDCFDIGVEWYQEGECKKSVSGRRSITKEEMVTIIDKLYNVQWAGVKWIDQGVADSLAVFHLASKESSVIKMLR